MRFWCPLIFVMPLTCADLPKDGNLAVLLSYFSSPCASDSRVSNGGLCDRDIRQVAGDRWHVTGDMWHVTCDMWHMTHDIWKVTSDRWHVYFVDFFGFRDFRVSIYGQVTGDIWYMTGNRWHLTHDLWHVTCDMWLVTCDTWFVCVVFLCYWL